MKSSRTLRLFLLFLERYCPQFLVFLLKVAHRICFFHTFFFSSTNLASREKFYASDICHIHFHTRSNAGIMAITQKYSCFLIWSATPLSFSASWFLQMLFPHFHLHLQEPIRCDGPLTFINWQRFSIKPI